MEVRIQRLEPMKVAARRHEGPYEGLAQVVDEVVRWLKTQKTAGGAVTAVFDGPADLKAGDPTSAEDETPIQAEIWVPWQGPELPGDAPGLTLKETTGGKSAVLTHTGHPLGIPRLALAMRSFLEREGHTPRPETRVVHLMPDWEQPENWVAEVQVPLTPGP